MITHIDTNNNPTMVDVTDKEITKRTATAQTSVLLPKSMGEFFNGEDFIMKKGPVFHTAIIAGTMAVKKTYDFIPFCHQIPIEGCKFNITSDKNLRVSIECTVKTTSKTGVEMEALHGATTAALTIYDMCKAISHEIVIGETKLLLKTGGKRQILDKPLFGLVLTGGKSSRMNSDKALLEYNGKPHALYLRELLLKFCDEVYLSAKDKQWENTPLSTVPTIVDSHDISSPSAGILSAFEKHPEGNWLIVACDLAFVNEQTIKDLLNHYDKDKFAVAYKNRDKDFFEPLCTLYTPKAKEVFIQALENDIKCPVKIIKNQDIIGLTQSKTINLANINTPSEYKGALNEIN